MVVIMALPPAARSFRVSIKWKAVVLSKPFVGSSAMEWKLSWQ